MTEQAQQTEDQATGPVQVKPDAGSRLEQLHASYAGAKAALDEATTQVRAITDAIKLELTTAAPDQTRIELVGEGAPALRLSWTTSWRFDSRRLKAEDPELYVRYAKPSGTWVLKAVGGAE